MPRSQNQDAGVDHLQPLAAALCAIISEYMAFMASQAPDDAKIFAARHSAGKAAVGHLTALSKLLHWSLAASAGPNPEEGEAMDEMLKAAREAMSNYDDGEDYDT